MNVSKKDMLDELYVAVLPWIRRAGFKGSFPHFRRIGDGFIDLLTFQFDRNGGGFIVEIARCDAAGIVTATGRPIAPNKVTAWDVNPSCRRRIVDQETNGVDGWFRYDRHPPHEIGSALLRKLDAPDVWEALGPFGKRDEQHLILKT